MKFILILLTQSYVFAAASSGGSISDLIVPAINFSIVFGFIAWKMKGPMKKMFDENAVKVKESVELASQRDIEAQHKLDMYEKKISGLNAEIKTIMTSAESDSATFEKNYLVEVKESFVKMAKDSDSKLESEKSGMLKMLNATLLDAVISKAKATIIADSALNKKSTDNIISSL